MDKQTLKSALETLNPDDRVTVNYTSQAGDEFASGEYTVVRVKTGRGKGGSKLVEMKDGDDNLVTFGTPNSDKVLNVVLPDGTLMGHETEAEVPKVYKTDAEQANKLKAQLKTLVGRDSVKVRVGATVDELNGDFTMLEAKLLRGRYGQVVLRLQAEDGSERELWSYRHSGVVTSFETL